MQKKGLATLALIGIIALVVVVVIGGFLMTSYNRLITLQTNVDTQWAQVETQYQRRLDLIPNLVESVKGVMQQEQEIFTAIAEARTRYAGAQTPDARAQAAGELEAGLGRLLVVMENYPQLRSSDTVQTLMAQIEGTENRISVERGRYNTAVQNYNLATQRVPGSIVAGMFGFDPRTQFVAETGA